jgi:uncharacterized protein involved in exopolysaccharide biosynthesis
MRAEAAPERETTLRDFVAVVFRRKGILLAVLFAALFGLVWINARTPTTFLSTARLLVNRGEPESVYNSRYKLLSWEEDVASEIEVLRSTILGERAQKILKDSRAVDSRGEPVAFRAGQVATTTSGKASVLVVSYTGYDPVESQEALRALTRAYIDWRSTERNLPIVDGFFQEELESLRDRLSEWEQRRADFMTEEGIVYIPGERESILRQRENAADQLTTSRMRVADFSARLEVVRNIQQERVLNAEIEISGLDDAEFADDVLLVNLRRELSTRRTEYFAKLSRYTEEHPDVRAAKEVVERLQAQFDSEMANYVRVLEARIEISQARVRSLEATMRALDEESLGLPDKEARLAQYDRIIDALKKDYSTMVDRQITAKVETTGKPEWRVILLQPATEAIRERTRDYVRFTLIPLFSLLIGLALAFVIDGLDHSLKDAAEAEHHLGVPVLGSLSRIR